MNEPRWPLAIQLAAAQACRRFSGARVLDPAKTTVGHRIVAVAAGRPSAGPPECRSQVCAAPWPAPFRFGGQLGAAASSCPFLVQRAGDDLFYEFVSLPNSRHAAPARRGLDDKVDSSSPPAWPGRSSFLWLVLVGGRRGKCKRCLKLNHHHQQRRRHQHRHLRNVNKWPGRAHTSSASEAQLELPAGRPVQVRWGAPEKCPSQLRNCSRSNRTRFAFSERAGSGRSPFGPLKWPTRLAVRSERLLQKGPLESHSVFLARRSVLQALSLANSITDS